MSEPRNADDFCYRHPDRRSFVLCQRCLRTVCPECQTPAAVGVICPECMKEQRKATPPRVLRAQRAVRVRDSRPLATYTIIGITVALFLVTWIPGLGGLDTLLGFYGRAVDPSAGTGFQPWRVLTPVLAHGGFPHLLLNMLALWMLGRSLEPLLGRTRFVALYLLSALGGSAAVALLAPNTFVIGASGAIFGLFGALLVIGRHLGANITGIAIVLAINLVIGFIPGLGVSWQAHVGGLVAGALAALILARTRRADQRAIQVVLLVVLCLVLFGAAFVAGSL